jgi:hypothetical protein
MGIEEGGPEAGIRAGSVPLRTWFRGDTDDLLDSRL